MLLRLLKICFLILPVSVPLDTAAREKAETWLEVRSPHFIVASNAGEKQARRVADQFERIRSVFHLAFPQMRVDPGAPIIVLATKDEKSFKALVPESWLEKGQLKRSGMFLRGPEKNYVLLRLGGGGDNPYHLLYHEYTHLIIDQSMQSVPLWLNEGLAEFYGNSEILGKEVRLGLPSEGRLLQLSQNKLIPLETLFAVDHSSAYYNEENRGSLFYSESWALTHYLMKERQGDKNPIRDFMQFLGQGVETHTAATRAFGDLKELERHLEAYVRQSSFNYLLMKASAQVDEDAFEVRDLSESESAGLRGDFLVYNQRYIDAKSLLGDALRLDPNNAQAQVGMGFLEFRQNHREEAKKWFAQAVKLDSKSYLAHYYYAAMTMQGSLEAEASAQIESSLRRAIQINPNFAPAYNTLAAFYGMKGEKLDEARLLALQAVQLEPGNIHYFLTSGSVMLRMNRPDDAVRIGERALTMAKSASERAAVQSFLDSARQLQGYVAAQKKAEEEARAEVERLQKLAEENKACRQDTGSIEIAVPQKPETAAGSQLARATSEGTIVETSCSSPPSLKLTLALPTYKLELHARNYFQVEFLTTRANPPPDFNPCRDIKGKRARIVYTVGAQNAGEIVSVELRR